MAKRLPKTTRRGATKQGRFQEVPDNAYDAPLPPHQRPGKPLEAQTEAQGQYIAALNSSEIIFGVGPAGTGKTYVAATWAAERLLNKQVDQIIITRPNVEAGEEMGHLPGELEEKYAPYLAPFRDVMIKRMGKGHFMYARKSEQIMPEPIGFMRGKTFNDAIVILDEAQNITPEQMKMFLTRIGKNCTMVIDGDPEQCDLDGPSGLSDALKRIPGIPGVKVVKFTEDDIVRNGIIKSILRAYRN